MKRYACLLAAALAVCAPGPSRAETWSEVVNGATCVPYPPFNASDSAPYSFFLYGFRQSAFCHFEVPDDWNVNDISYVLFAGSTGGGSGSGSLRVRLCVYSAPGFSTSCGFERTISSGGATVNWVTLPATMPSYPSGAYLSVKFPANRVSTLQNFIPVLIR